MASVRTFAPAKINLFLHVTGKRDDGYHQIESLVAFADIGDDVVITPASEASPASISLAIDGPFAGQLTNGEDNLVLKAARFLLKDSSQPRYHIQLTKTLPVASGIGGGSADAAATLRGLQQLRGTTELDLSALSKALGADVPVCLRNQPVVMRGIGEILNPVETFPSCDILLINPNKGLSTAEVFHCLRPPYSAPITQPTDAGWKSTPSLVDFLQTTRNDLIKPALELVPEVSAVVAALSRAPGCMIARMSGSGATCFGIFETTDQATAAAQTIAEGHPSWWIKQGKLGHTPV